MKELTKEIEFVFVVLWIRGYNKVIIQFFWNVAINFWSVKASSVSFDELKEKIEIENLWIE